MQLVLGELSRQSERLNTLMHWRLWALSRLVILLKISRLPANTDVGFQLCTLIGSPTQRRSACRQKITKLELAISTSKFCLKIFLYPAHGSKLQAGVAQWCSKSFASCYWRLETGFQDSWCAFAGLQRSNERRLFCSIMGNRCWCDDF